MQHLSMRKAKLCKPGTWGRVDGRPSLILTVLPRAGLYKLDDGRLVHFWRFQRDERLCKQK